MKQSFVRVESDGTKSYFCGGSGCRRFLPESRFFPSNLANRTYRCKQCMTANTRQWRKTRRASVAHNALDRVRRFETRHCGSRSDAVKRMEPEDARKLIDGVFSGRSALFGGTEALTLTCFDPNLPFG